MVACAGSASAAKRKLPYGERLGFSLRRPTGHETPNPFNALLLFARDRAQQKAPPSLTGSRLVVIDGMGEGMTSTDGTAMEIRQSREDGASPRRPFLMRALDRS
jgi:hypothetical protein